MTRTVEDVDNELFRAWWRRQQHFDRMSRDSNMRTIDVLLDERFALKPVKHRR